MNEENLISRLANQGAKIALPNPLSTAIFLCVGLFFYVALMVFFLGVREDFLLKINQTSFAAELLICLLMIVSSVTALAYLRFPNWSEKIWVKNLPVLFFALFSLLVTYRYLDRANDDLSQALCSSNEYSCLMGILVFSIIPVIALLIILRQGVVTNFPSAALMIGISGGVISYLMERLIHEGESFAHLFIWNFLPIFLVILAGVIFTKIFTKKL